MALRKLEREHEIYLAAYVSEVAKSTKKIGKKIVPAYPTFKDFYDYEEKRRNILGDEKSQSKERIAQLIVHANSLMEK